MTNALMPAAEVHQHRKSLATVRVIINLQSPFPYFLQPEKWHLLLESLKLTQCTDMKNQAFRPVLKRSNKDSFSGCRFINMIRSTMNFTKARKLKQHRHVWITLARNMDQIEESMFVLLCSIINALMDLKLKQVGRSLTVTMADRDTMLSCVIFMSAQ